jgi:hypothetical protein
MIDFRVPRWLSLVSVFLALAVGIVLRPPARLKDQIGNTDSPDPG